MEEFHLYALLVTLTLIIPAFLFTFNPKNIKKKSPPSPPTLPIIGNLHQLGPIIHRSLHHLSQTYGPVMLLKFGSKPVLVISSADAAREATRTHDLAFSNRPDLRTMRQLFCDLKDPINLPYGDKWRALRAIFVHELLGPARVRSFDSVRESEVSLLMERLGRRSPARPADLTAEFATLNNNLICRTAFGEKTVNVERVLEVIDRVVDMLSKFRVGDFVPWLAWIDGLTGFDAARAHLSRDIDDILETVLEDHLSRKEGVDKDNFMDILLGIYKGDVRGVSIDRVTVKAMIFDVIGAGTETSAKALMWIMTELIRHPHVMKKLQDEVRGVTEGKTVITEDDIQRMPYLKAVIKESLRIHPPFPIYLHEAREHVNFMGYDVEPETIVLMNVWAIGQDRAFWKDPERFIPERFVDSSVDYRGFDFQLLPFGAGRRICPGIGFAAMGMEHTVANLVKNFDFELPGGARVEDLDVTERPGFAVGKKEPLVVVPRRVEVGSRSGLEE
ncbi:cytochrome P450 [Striga asiatica]|uniref:Cytochrome P450 n=1 Tax=Striga asiatica TaxID=4170 RepID=A0A5A7P098_STRAF|nr:cytochrome P450 [Striga asiatica]